MKKKKITSVLVLFLFVTHGWTKEFAEFDRVSYYFGPYDKVVRRGMVGEFSTQGTRLDIGRYPKTKKGLDQFIGDCRRHRFQISLWLHSLRDKPLQNPIDNACFFGSVFIYGSILDSGVARPAIVRGSIVKDNGQEGLHAWVEVALEGRIYVADLTRFNGLVPRNYYYFALKVRERTVSRYDKKGYVFETLASL